MSGTSFRTLRLFDALHARKDSIETAFGGPLDWQRLDEKRACRISALVTAGGWRDEPTWPDVQEQLISAMERLEKAMRPHLNELGF